MTHLLRKSDLVTREQMLRALEAAADVLRGPAEIEGAGLISRAEAVRRLKIDPAPRPSTREIRASSSPRGSRPRARSESSPRPRKSGGSR